MMPTKLTVILKTGEVMTYSDAEVEERSGSCRLRVQRDGMPLDSFQSEDVERWFLEPLGTRSGPGH